MNHAGRINPNAIKLINQSIIHKTCGTALNRSQKEMKRKAKALKLQNIDPRKEDTWHRQSIRKEKTGPNLNANPFVGSFRISRDYTKEKEKRKKGERRVCLTKGGIGIITDQLPLPKQT